MEESSINNLKSKIVVNLKHTEAIFSFLLLNVLTIRPLRSATVNPAALPLLTVAPYARPLPGGKAVGLTILFPMEKSALPKKRTVGRKTSNCFFRPADVTMGKRSTAVTKGGRGYGDCASPNPCDLP